MIKIGLINGKGGAGKSTTVVALGAAFAQKYKTAIVDLDPQSSLGRWWEMTAQPANLDVFTAQDPEQLKLLSSDYEFVFVDTKGELSADALPYLDVALLPVAPSMFDIWALADTVEIVKHHQLVRPELKAAIFVNRLKPNTILGKDIQEGIFEYDLPCLRATIRNREGYPLSIAKGLNPLTLGDGDIRTETLRFANFVKRFAETGETGEKEKKQ